jgi:hypothetical protein
MIAIPFLADGAMLILWLAIFRLVVFLAPTSFPGRGLTLLTA